MKKKKLIFLLAILVGGGLVTAAVIAKIQSRQIRERPPTITAIQEQEGIPIRAISPVPREMLDAVILDGTVEADKRAVLLSRVSRRIERITVDEGDRIEAGEPAIFLEDESSRSALQAAQTAREEENRNYQRAEALFESGAVARQALDQARVSRDRAEAGYLQARESFRDSEIASPLSGLVSRRWLEPGEFSGSDNPILEIVDIRAVEVHSPVSELLIGGIRTGQTALVQPDAYPGRVWESTVSTISPTTGENSRLFTVKIRIPNPDELLRPGMYARVEIVKNRRTDVLVIPQEAVTRDESGRDGVYLLEPDRTSVRFHPVEPGLSRDGMVEIVSGLDSESLLAADARTRLADGTRIRTIPEGPEK